MLELISTFMQRTVETTASAASELVPVTDLVIVCKALKDVAGWFPYGELSEQGEQVVTKLGFGQGASDKLILAIRVGFAKAIREDIVREAKMV